MTRVQTLTLVIIGVQLTQFLQIDLLHAPKNVLY